MTEGAGDADGGGATHSQRANRLRHLLGCGEAQVAFLGGQQCLIQKKENPGLGVPPHGTGHRLGAHVHTPLSWVSCRLMGE